jgi:hypothetical protein
MGLIEQIFQDDLNNPRAFASRQHKFLPYYLKTFAPLACLTVRQVMTSWRLTMTLSRNQLVNFSPIPSRDLSHLPG